MAMKTSPLLLTACVCALSSRAGAEVFHYRFAPGSVVQNRISLAGASLTGPSGQLAKSQFRTQLRQVQRVRSLAGGVATLEVLEAPVKSVTIAAGQTNTSKGSSTRSLVKITDRGRFLGREHVGGEEQQSDPMDGVDALYGLNFPARDVKPGDTWTDVIPVGEGNDARKVTVTTRYVGKETVRGRNCAKFSTRFTMPLLTPSESAALQGGPPLAGKLTGTVTTYFDPAAGVEVYSSGSVSMAMKADLSSLSAEAGELATVTRINVIQQLAAGKR
jgi:hypothetical protein